jgi:hypothetical protein
MCEPAIHLLAIPCLAVSEGYQRYLPNLTGQGDRVRRMTVPLPFHYRELIPVVGSLSYPFLLVLLGIIPFQQVLTLIGATLVVEYGAVAAGTTLGISPLLNLSVVSSVAFCVFMLSFLILDHLGEHSERIGTYIARFQEKHLSSKSFQKYGIFALLPAIIIAGFYVCPTIAWLAGWNRRGAIGLMLGGYILAAAVSLFLTQNLLGMFR